MISLIEKMSDQNRADFKAALLAFVTQDMAAITKEDRALAHRNVIDLGDVYLAVVHGSGALEASNYTHLQLASRNVLEALSAGESPFKNLEDEPPRWHPIADYESHSGAQHYDGLPSDPYIR